MNKQEIEQCEQEIQDIEQHLTGLKSRLEAAKANIQTANEPWKPGVNEGYWIVDETVTVGYRRNGNQVITNKHLLTNNCFKTKEQAERKLARDIAVGEVNEIIRKANGDWVPDWSDRDECKYQIEYNTVTDRLCFIATGTRKLCTDVLCISESAKHNVELSVTKDQMAKIFKGE